MTTNPHGGHEPGDIAPERVVQASLAVLALIVFTMVAMWLLLGGLERWQTAARPPAHKLAGTRGERLPPEPRLSDVNRLPQRPERGFLYRLAERRMRMDGVADVLEPRAHLE